MNTGRIRNTETITVPYFPFTHKATRVVTKHYANLVFYMDREKLALLTWLVYNCGMDNRIKYSTLLVDRFAGAVTAARDTYKTEYAKPIRIRRQAVRDTFEWLIKFGYIFAWEGEFFLNPKLSYQAKYITRPQYKLIQEQEGLQVIVKFIEIVNQKVNGKTYKAAS